MVVFTHATTPLLRFIFATITLCAAANALISPLFTPLASLQSHAANLVQPRQGDGTSSSVSMPSSSSSSISTEPTTITSIWTSTTSFSRISSSMSPVTIGGGGSGSGDASGSGGSINEGVRMVSMNSLLGRLLAGVFAAVVALIDDV